MRLDGRLAATIVSAGQVRRARLTEEVKYQNVNRSVRMPIRERTLRDTWSLFSLHFLFWRPTSSVAYRCPSRDHITKLAHIDRRIAIVMMKKERTET